jgi:hypothetical protein
MLLQPRENSPWCSVDTRQGGSQSRSGRCEEMSCHNQDSDSCSMFCQPVASSLLDCAIPALCSSDVQIKVTGLLAQWLAAVLNTGVRFTVMAIICLPTAEFRDALWHVAFTSNRYCRCITGTRNWQFLFLFYLFGWSRTESTITEAAYWPVVPALGVPLCPPQIPHDLTWSGTRAAAVESRRLTV